MIKNAILFFTHLSNSLAQEQLNKLCNEIEDYGDVYVLYDGTDNKKCTLELPKNCKGVFYFNEEKVKEHNFILYEDPWDCPKFYWYNIIYTFLMFILENEHYDYYYVIEYDVYFNGKWSSFFQNYTNNDADFLTSNLIHYDETMDDLWDCNPHWFLNFTVKYSNKILFKNWYRCFNPIFRISNKSAKFLIDFIRKEKNYGYFESFIPTVLKYFNYKVEQWKEIKGKNQKLKKSSMRYVMKEDKDTKSFSKEMDLEENILYHPYIIKERES